MQRQSCLEKLLCFAKRDTERQRHAETGRQTDRQRQTDTECVSVCLPSVRLNISLTVCVCLPFCPSKCVYLYVSFSVRLNFSLILYVCMSFCPSECVSLYVSLPFV